MAFLVLKLVLHAVVMISDVLCLSTKSRCSRCYMAHLCLWCTKLEVASESIEGFFCGWAIEYLCPPLDERHGVHFGSSPQALLTVSPIGPLIP